MKPDIIATLRANLMHAYKSQRPAEIGGGTFTPVECLDAARKLDAMLAQADVIRTLKRIETRLCRIGLHVGAKDVANIPDTDSRQLNLPI